MKILIVGTDFPPSVGGISTYTQAVAWALTRACEVTVLAPGTSSQKALDKEYPFHVVRTPRIPVVRILALLIYVPIILWGRSINVAIHTVWPTALVSHFWYWLLPVPYFVSVHASEILDDRRALRRRLKGYLKRWRQLALRKAKGIFPVSRYTANLVTALGIDNSRIQLITIGVDTQRFKPTAINRPRDREKKLLTVGRLDLHKGHDRVLEALALLKEERLTPRYIIVGQGEEEVRLRSMVRELGLEQQVEFSGFVPDHQLPEVYTASDIFIMASREIPGRLDLVEGFGISFLEASACGLPVVAGRSGGVPDAVRDGETGILVNPNEPKEIAHALKLLLTDPQLAKRLGDGGRRWAETEMNRDRVADRLLQAARELM